MTPMVPTSLTMVWIVLAVLGAGFVLFIAMIVLEKFVLWIVREEIEKAIRRAMKSERRRRR